MGALIANASEASLSGEVLPGRRDEKLARTLYEEMERLDPSDSVYVEWDELTDHERQFYILCVRAITREIRISA